MSIPYLCLKEEDQISEKKNEKKSRVILVSIIDQSTGRLGAICLALDAEHQDYSTSPASLNSQVGKEISPWQIPEVL